MIKNKHQRHAAMSWIEHWKASISTGGQSWMAQEQAQEEIMRLHRGVREYDEGADAIRQSNAPGKD